MQEQLHIRQIAVLGAGVMGAQIAAHCANSGFKTLLFDLPAVEGARNALVNRAIQHLAKMNPAPLAYPELHREIEACNYDDDLPKLSECTLIIEAIAERMDLKTALYERIVPFVGQDAILVSNTSGLSINQLAHVLPKDLQKRFCGVHFFNPPRYMHLAELIPAQTTSLELLDHLETWLTSMLGKGVIRAKDTPNFIANRIGVFSLLATLHHANQFGLTPDEVDALTGTLIGRPKSATYRTLDVVGLDTMLHVVNTMRDQLKDDPWHRYYHLPQWLMSLIEKGALGQKTRAGIYRKVGQEIEVFHPFVGGYQTLHGEVATEVLGILRTSDPKERMQRLFASQHPQACFLKACFLDVFHYSAYHLATIADTARDLDLAMCWGFGWQQGPFAIWQAAGFRFILENLRVALAQQALMSNAALPNWLNHLQSFYQDDGSIAPSRGVYQKPKALPVYQKQLVVGSAQFKSLSKRSAMFENDAVCLWHGGRDVAILSFKTKSNTIDQPLVDGLKSALRLASEKSKGLVIYQEDENNFCLGANLSYVQEMAARQNMSAIHRLLSDFQDSMMMLKYSPIPVVAALRGRALGGGAEIVLHCAKVVAHFESYIGLVETGVGLIPAGGGCKEMLIRAIELKSSPDLMTTLLPIYRHIAKGSVSISAQDAVNQHYLRTCDSLLMHKDEVLNGAIETVLSMSACNYKPPVAKIIEAPGLAGFARIEMELVNWHRGGFISDYDFELLTILGHTLCGGDVDEGTPINEQWILKLEREAFMQLVQNEKTQARMAYMLEKGKPLRN